MATGTLLKNGISLGDFQFNDNESLIRKNNKVIFRSGVTNHKISEGDISGVIEGFDLYQRTENYADRGWLIWEYVGSTDFNGQLTFTVSPKILSPNVVATISSLEVLNSRLVE